MLSIGDIAKRANRAIHTIRYVIDSREIKAIKKIGSSRMFSEEAAKQVMAELRAMDERRKKR